MHPPLLASLLVAFVVAASGTPAATAEPLANCGASVHPLGPPDAPLGYVAIDEVDPTGGAVAVWTYLESNGVPGLQRGGAAAALVLADGAVQKGLTEIDLETCQESASPDTLLL